MDFPLWLPAAALALQTPAPSPDSPASAAQVHRGETVVVTAVASRVAEAVDATPATVTVIRRQDLDRELARDVRDALRYEPGISIENAPARFGLGNINIRGLDGNRVQMLEDGIRLPDAYKVGSFSDATRNPFDVAMLSRIEVLRGPGSALYGSDALAGVISMTTLDPSDVMKPGARAGGIANAGWASADKSLHRDGIVAGRVGGAELLVGASAADGKEFDNRGTNDGVGNARTTPNPQDTHGTAQLAKVVVPTAIGRWRDTYQRYDRRVRTDVLSLNPQSAKTVSLFGDDGARRERYSVDGEFFGLGPVDRLAIVAYRQQSSTRDDTDEVRANTTAQCLSANGTVSCRRQARFTFDQDEVGVTAIGQSRIGSRPLLRVWSRIESRTAPKTSF